MENLSIKEENGQHLICFDSSYGKKLDSYLKVAWVKYNFEKRNSIKSDEFLDYLIRIFDNIHITSSMIKNENYDFSFEFNSIISKFNSLGFDINFIVKGHGYGEKYDNNKRSLIENYFNDCISNTNSKDLSELIKFIEDLYLFQVKVFKTRDLFILKDDLMKNLKDVCSLEVYNYYNKLYNSYLKEDILDLNKLENLFFQIQDIILDDWKNNLSNVSDYKPGSSFKFICHSVNSSSWSGEYNGNYVSASLITENQTDTYNSPFGFIMNPNDIVMASSEDLFIRNNAEDIYNVYLSGVLPIVQSFKTVNDNTLFYNEVVLDKFDPIGIFCITDGSKELNPYYLEALNLKKRFPNLPIIDLDVSFFATDVDVMLCRNGLVDTIEEELGIYRNGSISYYNYFNYFWDDFMSLKNHDYTSSDIINLFRKYYDLLEADIDDLLNNTFDDDFIISLIGANNRYNSVNKILLSSFDVDDLKNFYLIYSDLSDFSYNRLNKLFPNFNILINSLDNFLTSHNFDLDSFNILQKFNTFEELITYLDDFYGGYNASSNKNYKKNTYI